MPKDYDSAILQLYARTPAPCRDYCGLTVTETDVILNIWQVSFGPHIYPKRKTCLMEDYEHDKYLQSEIKRIYGSNVCEYITSIHKRRNLPNLPTKCFLNIIKHLATRDIRNLSQTSTILFNRCNMDNVWKIFFRKYMKRNPNLSEKRLAKDNGWKEALKEKFTKKITSQRSTVFKIDTPKNSKTKEENDKINRVLMKNMQKKPDVKTTNIKPDVKTTNIKPAQKSIPNVDINKLNNTNKLNTTKSSSVLEKRPTSTRKSVKLNPISSLVNLNKSESRSNKKSLPQVKSDLKLNNVNQRTKTAVKIEIPKELKNLLVTNKNTTNLKPKNYIKNNLNNK